MDPCRGTPTPRTRTFYRAAFLGGTRRVPVGRITMTKWRVVLVDVTGTGVRERVRRLYVARISNKLSADPLARSFIMTSTRSPGRTWARCHQRAYVRAWRPICISYDFETSMHAYERTSTHRAKTVVINDVTAQ